MDLSSGPVLVTGAAGFIGSHLVEALLEKQLRVRAFVKYNSRNDYGHLEQLRHNDGLEIITGDIRDSGTVATAVFGVNCVFHLAASIGIPYSYRSPADVVSINTAGTQNVLEAVRAFKIPRVVVTSTSEVYGTPLFVPIDEKHPYQAQSPYAASKAAADMLSLSYVKSYDVPAVIVRPFNTYGPRQSARAIIPAIISQALEKDEISLGSLEPRRDFLYVKDTVRAFLAAAEDDSSIGEVYNFGSGADVSIGELAELILGIMDRDIPIRNETERVRPEKSEVSCLLCNYGKAEKGLGWIPHTTLESGLIATINYIRANRQLYKADQYNV